MAGNQDSGRVLTFRMGEKELNERIRAYQDKTTAGEIELPAWADFCASLGYTEDDIDEVMENGFSVKGAYYGRAVALKNMAQWCLAQLTSNPNWGGRNAAKAIFLMKQGSGRMKKYTDNDKGGSTGPLEVKVSFGGNDARAKKAGK